MKLFIAIMALFMMGATVSACTNTVHGAGQDIERAGENIQESVEK